MCRVAVVLTVRSAMSGYWEEEHTNDPPLVGGILSRIFNLHNAKWVLIFGGVYCSLVFVFVWLLATPQPKKKSSKANRRFTGGSNALKKPATLFGSSSKLKKG